MRDEYTNQEKLERVHAFERLALQMMKLGYDTPARYFMACANTWRQSLPEQFSCVDEIVTHDTLLDLWEEMAPIWNRKRS